MKNLRKYIRGKRLGKEAHQIEFQAMKDPFLEDALEGYDLVEDDHIKSIDRLNQHVQGHFQSSQHIPLKTWIMAASILLCIGLGGFFWKIHQSSNVNRKLVEVVQSAEEDEVIDIAEPLNELPLSPPEIQVPATDTLTIYQPKDKERIEAARWAEIMRWREEQQKLRVQQLAADSMNTLVLPDAKAQTENGEQPPVSPNPQNVISAPVDSI